MKISVFHSDLYVCRIYKYMYNIYNSLSGCIIIMLKLKEYGQTEIKFIFFFRFNTNNIQIY